MPDLIIPAAVTIPDTDTLARALHAAYPPLAAFPWDDLRERTRRNFEAMAAAAITAITERWKEGG